MKSSIFLLFALIGVLTSNAQKIKSNEVPEPVKETFKRQFAAVGEPKWEMEKGHYEAEFKSGGVEQSVVIDKNGTVLETETEIAVSELPANVTDYIAKNYKKVKIHEASKIVDPAGEIM